MTYINKYSWKCLLGKLSKNVTEHNGLYLWEVGKRKHFCTDRLLNSTDLNILSSETNFHYLSEENYLILKEKFKIDKAKNIATTIDLTQLSISGNKNKSLRHSINRGKSYNLTIENNFRKIEDVKTMINEWSNVLAVKYFRDNSGKNYHYFANNFHQDCINVFLYGGDNLVAFGGASPPDTNGNSAYILGKALCHLHPGLSEFADFVLYQKCLAAGVKKIDLGQTTGGMIFYKNKFPGADTYSYYNGKIL